MDGDDVVPGAQFRATRAVTIAAEPAAVSAPAGLLSVLLLEIGDFPMMRRMLLGIRARAEHAAAVAAGRL
jgi:hypothetical protein